MSVPFYFRAVKRLSHWLPFFSHRNCNARSHIARLSYFLLNQNITPSIFYQPLLQFFFHLGNLNR
ncbi:hypothetical protein [Geminocystis sp. NIES-3709]|uniref:hypothetical protein n=1 Tax=Geminocystis sp. NIES-3709 TaxID=1617448 RepID=UPI00130EFEB4|nr:hypothetical protein [Geminocystis sp. NIES-3709]